MSSIDTTNLSVSFELEIKKPETSNETQHILHGTRIKTLEITFSPDNTETLPTIVDQTCKAIKSFLLAIGCQQDQKNERKFIYNEPTESATFIFTAPETDSACNVMCIKYIGDADGQDVFHVVMPDTTSALTLITSIKSLLSETSYEGDLQFENNTHFLELKTTTFSSTPLPS